MVPWLSGAVMATEAAAASESDTEKDIGQLRGLVAQQDDVAFLPLRREELGPMDC